MARVIVVVVVITGCGRIGFDPQLVCPPDYDLALVPGSRYRIVSELEPAWVQSDDCADDSLALTHLAVISDEDERVAIQQALDIRIVGRWWVGGVQLPSATSVDAGWIWLTGEPSPFTWARNEPTDTPPGEMHKEQFLDLENGVDGVIDAPGAAPPWGGLCECDGRAITDEARGAIDAYRQ